MAEVAPMKWGLVRIAALISSSASVPVMFYIAPVAGAVAALAATMFGMPTLMLASRWHLDRAWLAGALGMAAGGLAGACAGLLSSLFAFWPEQAPFRYVVSLTWQFAAIAAPFGLTIALVYWSRYVSTGWAQRHWRGITVALVCVTAIVFSASHEIR